MLNYISQFIVFIILLPLLALIHLLPLKLAEKFSKKIIGTL